MSDSTLYTRPAPAVPDAVDAHPDDAAVDRFAAAMKTKLTKKRAEGMRGWDDPSECSIEDLSYMLVQHLWKGDPVEIGNFAMMLHQRGGKIIFDDETRALAASHMPERDGDYFSLLVERARKAAEKASAKFPQPNYVALKIAEEAGEVVRGAVHYAEGRMEWIEVEGEIVQVLAMLIRLVTEGDQINGIVPPTVASVGEAGCSSQRASLVRAITARCEHGEVDFEDCQKCREDALRTRSDRETGRG